MDFFGKTFWNYTKKNIFDKIKRVYTSPFCWLTAKKKKKKNYEVDEMNK